MLNIYAISNCQNGYQEERVLNFVKNQNVNLINDKFCYRRGNEYFGGRREHGDITIEDILKGKTDDKMKKADEIWIIAAGFSFPLHEAEKRARKLSLKLKYFKINQTGRYVGRAYETKRKCL